MRALALLMFLSATLPMAFFRPIVGLMLWIMFSYLNPHRIAFGFATNFNWVMITALVTMFATLLHARQRQPLRMLPVIVLMSLFLVWTGLAAVLGVERELALDQWTQFFKTVLMCYFTVMLVVDYDRLHWVLWTIVLSFGFWAFKGGTFTVLTGGSFNVMGPVNSFFRDTNAFALVMCMVLPLMRYLQLHASRRAVRIGLWVLMGLTAVAIIGTYSRGGLLALSATMLMLIFKSRRRGPLLVIAPIVAIAIAGFMPQQWYDRMDTISNYDQDLSAQGRFDSWHFATNVALADPLFGGGMRVWASSAMWQTYGAENVTQRAIHSIFFQVLGENGFAGLALFVILLAATWFTLARIRRRARGDPNTQWMADLASMLQVSLVGYAAAGSLLPMPYFDLIYHLIALAAVLAVLLERARAGHTTAARSQGLRAAIGMGGASASNSTRPGADPRRPARPLPARRGML